MQRSVRSINFLGGSRSIDLSPFDVVVVGGGALGCAMSWEAVSRGLRVALLEQGDFGSATSANSLNIIHGGLRYLQKLDVRRARASSGERAVILRIAPHIVSPLECVIPTSRSFKRGKLAFAVGLGINRLIMAGQNRQLPVSHRLRSGGLLSKAELKNKVPGLSMQGVSGAAYWEDGCMSSGERLALAFAQSANESGAVLLGRVAAEGITSRNNRITGVLAKDLVDGDNLELSARVVLDCRGVGNSASPGSRTDWGPGVEFVKAVNVVIRDQGIQCAVGAPVRDENGDPVGGRLIFARPGNRETIVGTWYFESDASDNCLLPQQMDEVLEAINSAFPGWQVTPDEIVGIQVGFLPRKKTSGSEKLPIERPMIIEATSLNGVAGLWHVQTEKWTTVRALAERVVTMVSSKEGLQVAPSATHETPLCGGEELTLTDAQSKLFSSLSDSVSSRLLAHYGGRVPKVLNYAVRDPGLAVSLDWAPSILKAEIPYVLDNEMVRTIDDLKNRLLPNSIYRSDAATAINFAEIVGEFADPASQEKSPNSV